MADVSPSPTPSISLSRKLSNLNGGMSSKHMYDDVFCSAAPAKRKSTPFSLPVEDYGEIFGASRNTAASSIPVLDLPESGGQAEEFRIARNSGGVDYAGIFAGFEGDSVGVSFDDLVDQSKKTKKNSSQKPRNGAEPGPPSKIPNVSHHLGQHQASMNGPSFQSLDTVNQVNVLYNKANQMSELGSDRTTHIAHLHAVSGYTYLVDDVVPPRKSGSAHPSDAGVQDGKGNINPGTGKKHRNISREDLCHIDSKTRSLSGEVGPSRNNFFEPAAALMDNGNGRADLDAGKKQRRLFGETISDICPPNFKTRSLSGEVGRPRKKEFVVSAAGMMDNGNGRADLDAGKKQRRLFGENISDICPPSFKTRSLSGEVGQPRKKEFVESAAAMTDNGSGRADVDAGKKQRRRSGDNIGDICHTNSKTQSLSGEVGQPRKSEFLEPAAAVMDNDNGRMNLDAGKERRLSGENIIYTHNKAQPFTMTAFMAPQSVFSDGDSNKPVNPRLNGLDNDADAGNTPRTITNDIITGVDACAGKNLRTLHKEDVVDANIKTQTPTLEHPSTVPHSVFDNGYPPKSSDQNFKRYDNDTDRGGNGDSSPPILGEEFDVNSAAAVSAAAMKKAIEEAEARIRFAKEILARKMDAGSPKLSFKETLEVKPTSKIKCAKTDNSFRERKCEDHAQLGTTTQISMKQENGIGNGAVALGFEARTKTDGAEPMCKLDEMETSSKHEGGGGGEWEASKHLSQLFYGVKNKLVSFMSKQADSEKNVMQKETTHGECLEQSDGSSWKMKVDDSETETQRKSCTPSWLSNREWAPFKIGSVPEVNEPAENMLHDSVALMTEEHTGELGPVPDIDEGARTNDLAECELEDDEVGVELLCKQEIDRKKGLFSSVQGETQQEEAFVQSSGDYSAENDSMKLECLNGTLDTSEKDDDRLEKDDSFTAHEGIEVGNGKDEGRRMNELPGKGDIKKSTNDCCGSAASMESHEGVQVNKLEEEGQQQVNLKELEKGVHLVEDTCKEIDGNKEAKKLSEIVSTGCHNDISENDEKINRQNDENEETADMLRVNGEVVENDRCAAAAVDTYELDEVASQSTSEAGGHGQSNQNIENEALELEEYAEASEDVTVEDEKAYDSTYAKGCAHDENIKALENFSGENRNKMDAVMTSEPQEKKQEPISAHSVNELMREEPLRTSLPTPDAMEFLQFQKERRGIDVAFQSESINLHQSETEVVFSQQHGDECIKESKGDVSLENQLETLVIESVEDANASDAVTALNQGEEKDEPVEEQLLENADAVLNQGEEKDESSEEEKHEPVEEPKFEDAVLEQEEEKHGSSEKEKHEPVEELVFEDADAVLNQEEEKNECSEKEYVRDADEALNQVRQEQNAEAAHRRRKWSNSREEAEAAEMSSNADAVLDNREEKHESSENENLRDADEALNQLRQKQNSEAARRRRRWFKSREDAEAAEMPSLFEGTGITSEIEQNIAEERKSMHTVLASADELVDGSREDANSKEAVTGGVDQDGGKRGEAAHKRKRWFENRGEGVIQQPSLFVGNQTNIVDDVSENRNELEDSLEDCTGSFSSKSREDGNVNDAHHQEVPQNPGAATRRRRWFENGGKVGPAQRPSIFEGNRLASVSSEEAETRENETEAGKHDEASMDEEKANENCKVNQSNGSRKDLDEVNRREREKIAVERAIREARERAYAEAREKAERAAMERATAEMLQKGAAAVQDRPGKSSSETTSQVDKASVEAKLRMERAAVDRATAEARERALQKAMSEKISSKSKELGGRYTNERSSSMDTRHQSSSVDTRYSSHASVAEGSDGAYGETDQRRKAVLERNRRTMERASKALEEKNMRDRLAQKEQAERNRYADALDAEVKRWCSGKEGNLRALLSTLHYVLGSDCGWQPIPLTDLISATAVRKAYKRATLCVHPDKLQQRAATVQQKYICEKVFDLLKEAWNRFSPDER